TYLENLKGELSSVEAENAKLSDQVENLMMGYLEGEAVREIVLFYAIAEQSGRTKFFSRVHTVTVTGSTPDMCLYIHFMFKDLETKKAHARLECSSMVECQPDYDGEHGGCKFKILELNRLIEKKHDILKTLKNLDYTFRRCEGVLKIEDALTGLEVIEYEGNQIRLSLRTYIPNTDLPEQNHELAIELLDGTLELRNAEIFLNDVYIDEFIDAAKHQFSLLPMPENKNSLECGLLSIEYEDRDEMIVAHMVDGVDAFIKISQGWPIANSTLKLLSLKGSSQSSKEVTLSFICKVENKSIERKGGDVNPAVIRISKCTQERRHGSRDMSRSNLMPFLESGWTTGSAMQLIQLNGKELFRSGGADLVLGIQWLETLNTVQANWKEMFMIFNVDGKRYKWQGITTGSQRSFSFQYLAVEPGTQPEIPDVLQPVIRRTQDFAS
ncbi:hypothetical protein Tco_1129700, partial [Tanacetum coccineum]